MEPLGIAVLRRLNLDTGERRPGGLGSTLLTAWRSTNSRLVRTAVRRSEDELADGHALRRSEVDFVGVLDGPPGRLQLTVDLATGAGFWR